MVFMAISLFIQHLYFLLTAWLIIPLKANFFGFSILTILEILAWWNDSCIRYCFVLSYWPWCVLLLIIAITLIRFILFKGAASLLCEPKQQNSVANVISSVSANIGSEPEPSNTLANPDPLSWEPLIQRLVNYLSKACPRWSILLVTCLVDLLVIYGTKLKNRYSKKIIKWTTPCSRVVLPIARVSAPIKNVRYISVIFRSLMPRLKGRLK